MAWLIDAIGAGIIGVLVGFPINWIIYNHRYLKLLLSLLFRQNDYIRISYAYLFRIKIDNDYLLIKGNRINQYQPIGGVYKFFPSFRDKMNEWDIKEEKDRHFYEDGDLRMFVKGKNVVKLLKWIDTMKNRECNHIREFYEELIKPELFDLSLLTTLKFEFLNRVISGLHYSTQQQSYEILVFDIIDVLGIDDFVKQQIHSKIKGTDKIVLVSTQEIEKQCFVKDGLSTKIGEHCKYIL